LQGATIIGWEIGRLIYYKSTRVRYQKGENKITMYNFDESKNKELVDGYSKLKWYQWWR